jgi:hypothetical protein
MHLLLYSLPNTASAKGDGDLPEWFPPVANLIGHAGESSQVHGSGMRSFDLQCAVYNFDTQAPAPRPKSKEFTVRCFFDLGKRWESFRSPRARTLIHIVGQLVGYFQAGDHKCPAILITDYRSLTTTTSIDPAPASASKDTPVKPRYGPPVRGSSATPVSERKSRLDLGSPATPVSRGKSGLDFLESPVAEEPIEGSDFATTLDLDPATIGSSSTGTLGDNGTIGVSDHDNDDVLAEGQRRGQKRQRVMTAKALATESARKSSS